jgi:hypothetical protein
MAASASGAQNVYIFLAGPDNRGTVDTTGGAIGQPPALALLSNGGSQNSKAVVTAPPTVALPVQVPGMPVGPNGAPLGANGFNPLLTPLPVNANTYAGAANQGCTATTLSAMAVGQQLGGAPVVATVGF